MKIIQKIKLINFKRFNDFEVEFFNDINLLIGDNEAGKSSILTAIELVLSGNKSKIDALGIENIFNAKVISNFLSGEKSFDKLPRLQIELHLNEQNNPELFGRINIEGIQANGLQMVCEPNEELSAEIKLVLEQESDNFPFEYYITRFITFSGDSYTGYRKFFRFLSLDSTQINSDYATRDYINTVFESMVDPKQRASLANQYRKQKVSFRDNQLNILNDDLENYQFSIRTGSKSNLQTDLTITEDSVQIDHRGKGRQCFIKTEFALRRYDQKRNLDTLLLEEPENHLSHSNMRRLINRISESQAKQIFIATHSSLISSRLDLRKTILLNSNSQKPLLLKSLREDTAKFFIKAPDNNILEFILSSRVILVEGDAEYILIDTLYSKLTNSTLEADNVHVISVGGTSFKRYLDLANMLKIRTAVIRDNDKNAQAKCVDGYTEYVADNIKVFYEPDDNKSTFEICFYELNKEVCDSLFLEGRKTLTVLEYMLDNKADCAFTLLDKKSHLLVSPNYIKEAVAWINE